MVHALSIEIRLATQGPSRVNVRLPSGDWGLTYSANYTVLCTRAEQDNDGQAHRQDVVERVAAM
jgi:hypothetical protein